MMDNDDDALNANSLHTIRQEDSAAELSAQERVKPFTVAITYCPRDQDKGKSIKGTEDIFARDAADRTGANKEHSLRSIKFVVTGLVASSSSSPSGSNAKNNVSRQPSSPTTASSSSSSQPSASNLQTMKERFVERVVRPIESFLLPFGRLHIFPIVSPVSGKGLGVKLYNDARVIFERSHHHAHSPLVTKYRGHAEDWLAESDEFLTSVPVASGGAGALPAAAAAALSASATRKTASRSVIVAFGGDGMIHEAINGWFKREKLDLPADAAAFDERPIFVAFPTGSGCAVAACLGIIEPLDTALATIHAHWIAHDTFKITPTGPAAQPRFTKPEVVPPSPAPSKPGELPPSWDCIGWAKIKDKVPPPRIGILSMSTGLISDVDKGSETMRYLGNARFTVEMVRMVMGSTPKYGVAIRYKPAEVCAVNNVAPAASGAAAAPAASSSAADAKKGGALVAVGSAAPSGIEQFKQAGYVNSGGTFPTPCVRRALTNPLYLQNTAELTYSPAAVVAAPATAAAAPAAAQDTNGAPAAAAAAALADKSGSSNDDKPAANPAANSAAPSPSSPTAASNNSNNSSSPLPAGWKVLTTDTKAGLTYIAMVCNVPALARDCVFAPYSRCNDGALDIVTFEGTMGKLELTSALLKMEDGAHVDSGPKEKVQYVKASELDIRVANGLLMADGEIIPQCPCNVRVLPRSIKMVRTTKV
jgi:diacylglycerol kinase family enzyme